MSRSGWLRVVIALCVPLAIGLSSCAHEQVDTTGTNSVTVEVANLVGAQNTELTAEMSMNVDYGQKAPVWTFLTTTVTGSPFSFADSLGQLPEGEFDLMVRAGSDEQTEAAKGKGQGCEMTYVMGKDETVTIAIDGLNEFGDKGYGPCAATVTRSGVGG
jgi:hypothetical protein